MTAATPSRLAVAVATALLALLAPGAAGADAPGEAAPGFVPDEVVARFAPVDAAARVAALEEVDARGGRSLAGLPGTRTVELPPDEGVGGAVRELRGEPGVRWAEPNYVFELAAIPDDPFFPELWGLRNTGQEVRGTSGTAGIDVGAAEAWDETTGSDDVRIAIADSGIYGTHPDLEANLAAGTSRNFVEEGEGEADPDEWSDVNGHGTHVAGTVAAVGDNDLGVTGVAWSAELVADRVCGIGGRCTAAAIAEGLAYAGDIGARAVNVSIAGAERSRDIEEAIAEHPDTLYVVAAGNEGDDVDETPSYPCALSQKNLPQENLLCVAAIDSSGDLAGFSNYGDEGVDLGAPGTSILSTYPRKETRFDGSEGLEEWSVEPEGRWDYEPAPAPGTLVFDDGERPLPEDATLTSTQVSLDDGRDCRLTYVLRLDLVPEEQSLHVEASDDDGESWTALNGAGYSDETGKYVFVTERLAPFDGAASLRVRYRLHASPEGRDRGAAVSLRKPEIACILPQEPSGSYAFLQGTSMAAPHVTGVAALAWSAHPDASVGEVREAILDSAVATAALEGTTVSGGRVDAPGVLAALEPPEPEPDPAEPEPETADSDSSADSDSATESASDPGWALGLPATRLVALAGRWAVPRLRCRTRGVRRCGGQIVLLGIVRAPGGKRRRAVLGSRRYSLAAGRNGRRAVRLRRAAVLLLRAGRVGAVGLRIATGQPAGVEPRVRVRTARVALRPPRRR